MPDSKRDEINCKAFICWDAIQLLKMEFLITWGHAHNMFLLGKKQKTELYTQYAFNYVYLLFSKSASLSYNCHMIHPLNQHQKIVTWPSPPSSPMSLLPSSPTTDLAKQISLHFLEIYVNRRMQNILFFCLTFFTQCNYFEIHLCCCVWIGGSFFYSMYSTVWDVPQLGYTFTC